MTQGESLNELLAQATQGDKKAFARLIQRASDRIHAYFCLHIKNVQDSEDLLQDYWLRVWRGRKTYRADLGTWRWLTAIAVNVVRDHHRKAKANTFRLEAEHGSESTFEMGLDFDKVSVQCLRQLPPKQRLVFYLCGIRGMAPRDAAVLVEMNPSTLRNHLNQARRSLRTFLHRCFPEYVNKR